MLYFTEKQLQLWATTHPPPFISGILCFNIGASPNNQCERTWISSLYIYGWLGFLCRFSWRTKITSGSLLQFYRCWYKTKQNNHNKTTIIKIKTLTKSNLGEERIYFSWLVILSFFFHFFIRYLAHLHFQCYTKSPPYPPTSTPLPTHSPFLALAFPCTGAYKVCVSNGPLFPVMAD
jgi:hypothetical protein